MAEHIVAAHDVGVRCDGIEALEMLRNGAVPGGRRIVLLDLNMPRMNGIEFLQVIRSYLRWSTVPVVLLTAYDKGRHIEVAHDLHVDHIFLKGFTTLLEQLGLVTVGPTTKRLILVTAHRRENFGEPLENICRAIKDLALTVKNEFLKIKGHCFSYAEVLGILGNTLFHFLANPEEMVNSITAGEDHCRMILNINLLFPEFLSRNSFEPDEGMEIQLHVIFSSQLEIRRLLALRSGLGNQDFFLCSNPFFYHGAVRLTLCKFMMFPPEM